MTVKLLVKRVGHVEVPLPQYQTKGAVGLDLHAAIGGGLSIRPGEHWAIPTGLAFAIPEGYEGTVRARSGHARDYAVTVTNGIGTIDPDFRGELKVLLINLGQGHFVIKPMERIAQLVISPILRVEPVLVDSLDATERGGAGFGSTRS